MCVGWRQLIAAAIIVLDADRVLETEVASVDLPTQMEDTLVDVG